MPTQNGDPLDFRQKGDPLDFSDQYNTSLSPADEAKFQAWTQQQSKAAGRDVSGDTYDYDLRGWWQANPDTDLSGGHLTDQWKKPNHPTFSDESIYSGVNGMQGGHWTKADDPEGGEHVFRPGPTNMYSQRDLADYFARVEPTNTLDLSPAPPKDFTAGMRPSTNIEDARKSEGEVRALLLKLRAERRAEKDFQWPLPP